MKRLPLRQDSDYSWTIDFTERKREAKTQAEPFKKEAEAKKKSADKKREQLKKLKAAKTRNSKKIETLTIDLKQLDKEVRELNTKAQDIENAIYDLKAVNPNAKDETDTRTPAELLDFIEEKGKEVAEILARLK